MTKRMRQLLCLLMVLAGCAANAVSINDAKKALELPDTVDFIGFSYCKPKIDSDGWIVEDEETGEIVWAIKPKTVSSSERWSVQSKTEKYTMPQSGGSCLRSQTGMEDFGRSSIILRVLGPGTFKLRGKTAVGSGDTLSIYVDGTNAASISGCDYDTYYEPGTDDWENLEVEVPNGLTQEGTYAGTYYHEIIIEFEKDDVKTAEDGPEKPIRADYDDAASYNEDLAEYKKKLPYYIDCVWLDAAFIPTAYDENDEPINKVPCWFPEPVTLQIDAGEDLTFEGSMKIEFVSTAYDHGYTVHYTTNGTVPTADSPTLGEGDVITITETCTITAKVFDGNKEYSPEVIARQTFTKVMAAPVITLDAKASSDTAFVYTITSKDKGAQIFYRLNDGVEQVYTAPVSVTAAGTLTAFTRMGAVEGNTVSVTVNQAPAPVVVAECDGSKVASGTLLDLGSAVTLSASVASGTLMVRSGNGDWAVYDGAQTLYTAVTFQFKTVADGMLSSAVVPFAVRIADTEYAFDDYLGPALSLGWNLVSFPLELTPASQEELLAAVPLFGLNAQGSLVAVDSIQPVCGYFLYVADKRQLQDILNVWLWGAEPEQLPPLESGWNLTGPRREVTPAAYQIWSFDGGRFGAAGSLRTGCAYWVRAF